MDSSSRPTGRPRHSCAAYSGVPLHRARRRWVKPPPRTSASCCMPRTLRAPGVSSPGAISSVSPAPTIPSSCCGSWSPSQAHASSPSPTFQRSARFAGKRVPRAESMMRARLNSGRFSPTALHRSSSPCAGPPFATCAIALSHSGRPGAVDRRPASVRCGHREVPCSTGSEATHRQARWHHGTSSAPTSPPRGSTSHASGVSFTTTCRGRPRGSNSARGGAAVASMHT